MNNVLTFRPKEQKVRRVETPVLYAMSILQSQGCKVDVASFEKVDGLIGSGIHGLTPVTDMLSLQHLCNMNGFCVVFNGTSETVIAYLPGES